MERIMEALKSFFDFTPGNILHLIFFVVMAAIWIAGKISDRNHRLEMERILREREAIIEERNKMIEEYRQRLASTPK